MDNDQRKLLGLEVLRDSDTAVPLSANEAEEIHVYIREHTIIKLTQSTPSQYREIDYDIPVDAEHRLIGRKGSKPKPLTFVAIEKCKTKKMRLTIDRRFNRYKVKIGVTHFQVMDVQQELPAIEGLEQTLIAQYGSLEQWEQVRNLSMKKVKLRYTPKEGDIFSYPVDEKHYGFALIIGCFSRFRKKGIMPSDRKHYLNLMMGVPLLIRTFDFVSEKKLIDPQRLRAYPLLNPEILMDDYVLRGKFPVIGKTAITLDDLVLPMSFSFNGPHTTYAGYEAYHGTQWETLQRLQDQIVVRFDCGFGSSSLSASEFV